MEASYLEVVDSLGELKEEGLSYHFVVGEQGWQEGRRELTRCLAQELTHTLQKTMTWWLRRPSRRLTSTHSASDGERLDWCVEGALRDEDAADRGEQDYHYDNSPREIQQEVLRKQLRSSLASG